LYPLGLGVLGGRCMMSDGLKDFTERCLGEYPLVECIVGRRSGARLRGDGVLVEGSYVTGQMPDQERHGECPWGIACWKIVEIATVGDV